MKYLYFIFLILFPYISLSQNNSVILTITPSDLRSINIGKVYNENGVILNKVNITSTVEYKVLLHLISNNTEKFHITIKSKKNEDAYLTILPSVGQIIICSGKPVILNGLLFEYKIEDIQQLTDKDKELILTYSVLSN